jgi:hypothetical protein
VAVIASAGRGVVGGAVFVGGTVFVMDAMVQG